MTCNNQLHAPYICTVYSHTVGRVTAGTANRTNDVTVLARWKHTAWTMSQPHQRENTRKRNSHACFEDKKNKKLVLVPASTEKTIDYALKHFNRSFFNDISPRSEYTSHFKQYIKKQIQFRNS